MKAKVIGRLLATFALAGLASGAAAQQQTGFTWWKDDKVIKELALTPDQSTRIDAIFRATLPQLRQSKDDLDRQETELSRLIGQNADEGKVGHQVDKVEAVRGALNKTRTLMLLRMRQVLSPDQRDKFNAVHEQWLREHPRTDSKH
jgi:Spy/CpxP family protein refolding chaperone